MTAPRRLLLLLLISIPLSSHAFVVATARDGRMLRWSDPGELRFVVYPPEDDVASLPSREEFVEAIVRAAESWSDVEGSAVSIEIEVALPGAVPPRAGYDRDDPGSNVNSILFETEVWRHEPGAFAVTLRTYGSRTANFLHTDIVFNAVQYRWEILEDRRPRDPDGLGPVDVQGVATHEMGHALGFEHTETVPSAMLPTVGYGEIWMRDVSETDLDGLRFLYPMGPGSMDLADSPGEALDDVAALMGCSQTPFRPGNGDLRLLLLPVLFCLALPLGLRCCRAPSRTRL